MIPDSKDLEFTFQLEEKLLELWFDLNRRVLQRQLQSNGNCGSQRRADGHSPTAGAVKRRLSLLWLAAPSKHGDIAKKSINSLAALKDLSRVFGSTKQAKGT